MRGRNNTGANGNVSEMTQGRNDSGANGKVGEMTQGRNDSVQKGKWAKRLGVNGKVGETTRIQFTEGSFHKFPMKWH